MVVKLCLTLGCFVVSFGLISGGLINEEIYNGVNAAWGQFPYQSLLLNNRSDGRITLCGGSLISTRFVLTAAHCCHKNILTTVLLGVTDTSNGTGSLYYTVDKENTIIHPFYNNLRFTNDIALLRLPAEVPLNDHINTISLPKEAWAYPSLFDGYKVTASGWGQTYNDESGIHQILQYITVNVMNHTACAERYKQVNTITDRMICSDKKMIHAGPCHGDSGGPLTVNLMSGRYLLGCVSWGVGACNSTNPVVYTLIAYYLSWIYEIIHE